MRCSLVLPPAGSSGSKSDEADEWNGFSDDDDDAVGVEDLQASPSPRPQKTPWPPDETYVPAAPAKAIQAFKNIAQYDARIFSSDSLTSLPTSSTLPTSESLFEDIRQFGSRVTRSMLKAVEASSDQPEKPAVPPKKSKGDRKEKGRIGFGIGWR
jgi:hypothetical protein